MLAEWWTTLAGWCSSLGWVVFQTWLEVASLGWTVVSLGWVAFQPWMDGVNNTQPWLGWRHNGIAWRRGGIAWRHGGIA
jgi:hypothetical protein